MRQKLAVLLGSLAVGVLVAGLLRRRRRSYRPDLPRELPDSRADALRRQLAESRGTDGSPPDGSTVPAAGSLTDVEEARRRVHEHGRAAVEEMRRSGS